jgi:hypothetical protein
MNIEIYKFKHTDEIYSDMKGVFYRFKDDKPIPICYQNGRIAIRDRNKFYGIKRLRKNAYKTTKELIDIPF